MQTKSNFGKIKVSRVNQNEPDYINFYIGRSNKKEAPLSNPFKMNSEEERDNVCEKFECYFNDNVKLNSSLRSEVIKIFKLLRSGKNVNLQCFCSPLRCHGHTIEKFLITQLKKIDPNYEN